jgi:hypothetical protein
MSVIADNFSAIRELADRQTPSDLILRRLQDYLSLQYFACAWGLMPGSIKDEASPFNECAHAYLAAAQALLLHLRQMPGGDGAVGSLVARIEVEMLQNNTALALCRYSDEPFNTNEVIGPRWREIPFHPPSIVALVACGRGDALIARTDQSCGGRELIV